MNHYPSVNRAHLSRCSWPFVHVCAPSFFDAVSYSRLLSAWPAFNLRSMPETGRDIFARYFDRFIFEFTDSGIGAAGEHSTFLLSIRELLSDRSLLRHLLVCLGAGSETLFQLDDAIVDIIATEDRFGYSLSPH